MAEHIVGDWKDYTFHMAKMEDNERIGKHVRDNYLQDEPQNAGLEYCPINVEEHLKLVELSLTHGISYYVTKKGTDEIVAVQLLMESTKEGFGFVGLPEPESPNLQKIAAFVDRLHKTTLDVYHSQKKLERYVDIFITSVDKKYRGHGIAEEMYIRMIKFLKAMNFQAVHSCFSSPGTRAIVNKLNFTELGRLYFDENVDENGDKIFTRSKGGEFIAELVLEL